MPYWKAEVKARLAGLSLSPARELEIIEEISQHLQDRYEQELIRGATEEEAQRALLEELNAPELLGRELKQVERRVPQNPVVMGTLRAANAVEESRLHHRGGAGLGARDRREQRDLQRRQHRVAAAAALQESGTVGHVVGERDSSRVPKGHALARELP